MRELRMRFFEREETAGKSELEVSARELFDCKACQAMIDVNSWHRFPTPLFSPPFFQPPEDSLLFQICIDNDQIPLQQFIFERSNTYSCSGTFSKHSGESKARPVAISIPTRSFSVPKHSRYGTSLKRSPPACQNNILVLKGCAGEESNTHRHHSDF